MKKYLNYQRGLFGFGGANGISSRIEFCGKCIPGWKIFYEKYGYKYPWQMWFRNPWFDNRSGYDKMLDQYRLWFCFMWFSFDIRIGKRKYDKT